MPNVREQLPFVICSAGNAGSQVKHSSLDNSMPRWKDGKLVVAEGRDGHCVLIVEYKVGPPKSFKLFNNVKSKTYTQTNPSRLVIALKDGSMVHINHAPTVALSKLSEVIDNVAKQAKAGRQCYGQNCQNQNISPPSRSPQAKTVRMSPRNDTTTPKRVQRRDSGDSPRVGTKTPTPRRPNPFSPRPSRKRRAPDDDATFESDGNDEENLGVSMLFSDQVDKENQPTCERQSVLQMRKKGGGSIFMESFEEHQRQREEQKRKGPNPAMSVSVNFYNRNKQMAGYGASDIMSIHPAESSAKKKTPGLLSLSNDDNSTKPLHKTFSFNSWKRMSNSDTSRLNLQGFSNLGNTCYMNAILQSLLGLQCFIQDLQNLDLIRSVPKTSLYRALSRLLFVKERGRGSTEIEVQLQRVKAAISATATRFSGCMQHDAHEFLCQCLDQLKEDVDKVCNPKKARDVLDETKEATSPPCQVVPAKEEGSCPKFACAVSQNFEMEVVHSILCQGCGEEVTKKETFNDLSLDLPRNNETFTLQTALDSFFASEKLEYTCAKCSSKEAVISHKFTKLPRVLVLHLKRYTFDTEALANGKLRRCVGIPRYLTLGWHTLKNTCPPPAKTAVALAPPVPLSPLKENTKSPLPSPKFGGSGSAVIKKKLDYDNSSPSGRFKFKRNPAYSVSPKKETSHFISRFEPDFKQEPKKDQQLEEMDEDQQMAYALELSRQEAASRMGREIRGRDEDPTEEELLEALNTSEAEFQAASGVLQGGTRGIGEDSGSDTDDDLPPGLLAINEDEKLQWAMELSRRCSEEEESCRVVDGHSGIKKGVCQPVGEVGLLGGAREDGELMDKRVFSSRIMLHLKKSHLTKELLQSGREEEAVAWEYHVAGSGHVVPTRTGLLGGARVEGKDHQDSAVEEPMDTEEDQPLAFTLQKPQGDDPSCPKLWDTDSNPTSPSLQNQRAGGRSSGPRTHAANATKSELKKDAALANSGDRWNGEHQLEDSEDSNHSGSNTWRSAVRSDPQDVQEFSSTTSHERASAVYGDSSMWKKNECKRTVFQPQSSETPSEDEVILNPRDEARRKPLLSCDDGGTVDLDLGDDSRRGDEQEMNRTLSYDEMKAKEDEDIRRATELSMQEAKAIEDREAAELLKAQEMSLQDYHQSVSPERELEMSKPVKISPIYSQEEKEMLRKNSEDGHLANPYRLVSIVSHIGSSSLAGHYISDVYDPEKRSWLSYDDSNVMKTDELRLREDRQRTGYIFFYLAKQFL